MKYTPDKITSEGLYYSIPIYQRLFEWDTNNILTHLSDLKRAYELSNGKEDYYIGMLTSTNSNEIVDGQQRFTVLMLIGCVLKDYNKSWANFLSQDRPRLRFTSRPLDDAYLQALIEEIDEQQIEYTNLKMKNGKEKINQFFINLKTNEERKSLATYIYNHLSFFISVLPQKYSPQDLNKYFERINSSGKNLEQHEILKVKMLSHLSGNISQYMQLWNRLADVDTLLIRKRTHKNESEEAFANRKATALKTDVDSIIQQGLLNGIGHDNGEEYLSICSIEPSKNAPTIIRQTDRDTHCVLRFPYLLLQALYWKLKGNIRGCSIDDFFNTSNLLNTFDKFLPYEGDAANPKEIHDYIDILLRCRLVLDVCFVRPTEYGYALDMNLAEDNEHLKELIMLESMLFISSSNTTNYKWFGSLMSSIESHKGIPSAKDLFIDLKHNDDEEHKIIPKYDSLSYGEIRYWFWRLDLYIWLNRKKFFAERSQAFEVAEKYVFIRNRSIEHIAPQTPLSVSNMKWKDTEEDIRLMNSFGNLVMISQGLNSALHNESYEVKKAHVQSYCNGGKSGSIESLKLLIIHNDYQIWNRDTIKEHGLKMHQWLLDSFEK